MAHAYAGAASRYVGDDYCGGYIFHQEGFWGGQRWFYTRWGAVPSTVFLIGATEPFGMRLTPVLAGIAVALWVAVLAWTLHRLFARIAARVPPGTSLLAAELIVFATLRDTPNVTQSLYLRVPMFEYVVPLILLTAAVGWIVDIARRRTPGRMAVAGCALLAFVAGSFGPTYAAMQTVVCAIALAANRVEAREPRRLEAALVSGLAGSIAALVFIAVAPGNAVRQGYFPPPPGPLGIAKWTVLSTLFMFARPVLPLLRSTIVALVPHVIGPAPRWLNTALSMTSSPITLPLVVGVPFWLAAAGGDNDVARGRRFERALVWLPVAAVVLVMACMAPSAYGTSSPPPPRTLVIPQFVLVTLLAAWSYAAGAWLRGRVAVRSTWRIAAAAVVVVVAIVAPLRSAQATFAYARELHAWARRWDEADRQLRIAHREQRQDVDVPEVGAIAGVGAIAADPNDWVNACAARYYDVRRISGRPQP